MSIFHTSQCLWHLVKSHTMDDRRNSVIQVFLDPSTSRSDVVKITIKWECCVICHVRKIKRLCLAKGKNQLLALDTTLQWKCHAVSLNLFTTCGHWPRPVEWWGRHWGCIKEPFSIMAQNLLSCALKLERASKRKQRDIWMRQSMQDTV